MTVLALIQAGAALDLARRKDGITALMAASGAIHHKSGLIHDEYYQAALPIPMGLDDTVRILLEPAPTQIECARAAVPR